MAIEYDYQNQRITVNGIDVIDSNGVIPENVTIIPSGGIDSTNLADFVTEVGGVKYYQASTSTPINPKPSSLWYQTDTSSLLIYREVAPASFQWVYLMIGNESPSSDVIDAGAF